jgi:hypothetical protein
VDQAAAAAEVVQQPVQVIQVGIHHQKVMTAVLAILDQVVAAVAPELLVVILHQAKQVSVEMVSNLVLRELLYIMQVVEVEVVGAEQPVQV